ncbi:Gfo/Idh/MocA family oxidoreductase, partial [Nonomuraea fuscirosea]
MTGTKTYQPGPLRWGIIGTGGIAGQFADDLRHSGEGELVAVASRSTARAEAFAARTAAPRSHGTHAALLESDHLDPRNKPVG